MSARWILVADESRARIFQEGRPGDLQEIADFANPQGRAKERDLLTAPQGRLHAKGGAGQPSSDTDEASEVAHATEKFAKDLARHLDRARSEKHLERLELIAAPRFLGVLRKNISKEVHKLIAVDINKDLSGFDPRTIAAHLADARRTPG